MIILAFHPNTRYFIKQNKKIYTNENETQYYEAVAVGFVILSNTA